MEILGIGFIIWAIYSVIKGVSESSNKKTTYYYPPTNPIYKPNLNVKGVDLSDIKLSLEQQKLFSILESTNEHVFVTGKAGTGKSILLQYFRQNSKKRIVVCAPTGVAALNVVGQTIHSLFKIPPEFIKKGSLHINYKTALLLRNIDTVVIDEISMVRADLMDAIDDLLRQARKNDVPFGGVQMIMFGDMYQLPPVVNDPELHKYFTDNHDGYYFFNAHAWLNNPLKVYELSHIFRQKDNNFIEILNAIRLNEINEDLLGKLNLRVIIDIPTNGVITLATTNDSVNKINEGQLAKLNGKVFEYKAIITGKLGQSSFPTEETLRLKKGAQVMLIKNDKEKRWVNGTIGFIDSLSNTEVKVNIDGFVYSIAKETWSKVKYYYNQEAKSVEQETESSFTQLPLRLAWAITIHKSQGKTFGSAVIDLGDGAFTFGQTYVALSRCQTLEGLYLRKEVMREDIMVDPVIINFMKQSVILKVNQK